MLCVCVVTWKVCQIWSFQQQSSQSECDRRAKARPSVGGPLPTCKRTKRHSEAENQQIYVQSKWYFCSESAESSQITHMFCTNKDSVFTYWLSVHLEFQHNLFSLQLVLKQPRSSEEPCVFKHNCPSLCHPESKDQSASFRTYFFFVANAGFHTVTAACGPGGLHHPAERKNRFY